MDFTKIILNVTTVKYIKGGEFSGFLHTAGAVHTTPSSEIFIIFYEKWRVNENRQNQKE